MAPALTPRCTVGNVFIGLAMLVACGISLVGPVWFLGARLAPPEPVVQISTGVREPSAEVKQRDHRILSVVHRRRTTQSVCPHHVRLEPRFATLHRQAGEAAASLGLGARGCLSEAIEAQACDEEQYTVVVMSYPGAGGTRLERLASALGDILTWKRVAEVVFVWNGPRISLESQAAYASFLPLLNLTREAPLPSRGLRFEIFEANSLLNRYHPHVAPRTKAAMFVDDDGPFLKEEVAEAGFLLWRQKASQQVGAFGRHFRSDHRQVHLSDGFFQPYCAGDSLRYHFKAFADFHAHMVLPSFSFLHRGYFCYAFSEAFRRARLFVDEHETHPDDVAMSFLVSHLSGLPPATYPRRLTSFRRYSPVHGRTPFVPKGSSRRMLLFQDEKFGQGANRTWVPSREEAIHWFATFFGSINPGSRGWCDGVAPYHVDNKRPGAALPDLCQPAVPQDVSVLPWMNRDCHAQGAGAAGTAPAAAKVARLASDPRCTPRPYPAPRYYGMRQADISEQLPFLQTPYVRGKLPAVLPPSPGPNPRKLCFAEDEQSAKDFFDTDGYNPSIVRVPIASRGGGAEYLAAMVVSRGQCEWPWPENSAVNSTVQERTVIVALDKDLRVVGQTTLRIHFNSAWGSESPAAGANSKAIRKFDDAKLLRHHDDIYVTYRYPAAFTHKNQLINPLYFSLSPMPAGASGARVRATIAAKATVKVCCGRNIGFMSPPDEDPTYIFALIWMRPLQIQRVNLQTGEATLVVNESLPEDPADAMANLHGTPGGLPYLPKTDEFLGLAHLHRPFNRKPSEFALHGHHYTHAFFTIPGAALRGIADDGTRRSASLARLGNEFCFPSLADAANSVKVPPRPPTHASGDCEMIQYASGLTFMDEPGAPEEPGRVLLSYGVNDCESAVIQIQWTDVLGTGLAADAIRMAEVPGLASPPQR